MNEYRVLLLPISLWFLLVAFDARAGTRTAASCSLADVSAAISEASNGDTVYIPAGSCTWTSSITVNSAPSRPKMVAISGAGTDRTTGTVITANDISGAVLRFWLTHTTAPLEIRNIRFVQGSAWTNNDEEAVWAIALRGHADTEATLLRIHHCAFDQQAGNIVNSIRVGGLNAYSTLDDGHPFIWGVIDHNTWTGTVSFQGVDVMPLYSHDASGAVVGGGNAGNLAWRDYTIADHQGTWRNVFLEDNVVTSAGWTDSQAFMDGSGGSAIVFRRNLLRNNWVTNHGADSGQRSCRWMEVYDNIFVLDLTQSFFTNGINTRGGTGVIYGNRFFDATYKGTGNPYNITGTVSYTGMWLGIDYYRATDNRGGDYICASVVCGTDPIVGCDNKDDSYGWICRDQPGSTRGANQAGWAFGYRWATHPTVYWQNFWGDTSNPVTVRLHWRTGLSNYIKDRREYIENGSCSSHMAEPICSAFWDAVNGRKKGYSPYAYPHPKTLSDPPPSPPKNLRRN